MSNFDDTNSLAGSILGDLMDEVDESKRLVEFEDPEDEMLADEADKDPEMLEPPKEAEGTEGDMQADGHFGDMEQDMSDLDDHDHCDDSCDGSMLDRMAGLAADATNLSTDLAGIATEIGGGSEFDSPEMTVAESEEIDVAMIDDIQERIDSIAASMEALRNRGS